MKQRQKQKEVFHKIRKSMTKEWAKRTVYQVTAFLVSVAMVYGVVSYAVGKSYRARKLEFVDGFTITAHTGSMDTKDNSLESIRAGAESGADIIEFDVAFRPDKTPVMSHDLVVTNKQGVPVEEAFKLISKYPGIKVNLDIKETTNLSGLQELVLRYNLLDRVFLTGVSQRYVDEVKAQCPQLKYYLNMSPSRFKIITDKYKQALLEQLETSGAVGINCNYNYAGERLSGLMHENGYLLSVWTANNEDDMARCLAIKPDNITTRHPDVLIQLIENWRV